MDLDGVLADFDKSAAAILKTNNIYRYEFMHGAEAFWQRIHTDNNFFAHMEPMEDSWDLMGGISHLDVSILTAKPKTNGDKTARQKRQWVKDHWGDYKVITCFTKDKPNYCEPGAVLIDDRTVNRANWERMGGILVHHTSAANTLTTLRALGAID